MLKIDLKKSINSLKHLLLIFLEHLKYNSSQKHTRDTFLQKTSGAACTIEKTIMHANIKDNIIYDN